MINAIKKSIKEIKKNNLKDNVFELLKYIVYVYIVISPFLDMLSYVYRNNTNITLTPTTIVKPFITLSLTAVLFILAKKKEKLVLICFGIINIIYMYIHYKVFNSIETKFTDRTVTDEMRMISNYIFGFLNLYILFKLFYNQNRDILKLKKSVVISLLIYVVSILITVIVGISPTTYLEGQGYKGFYESGNSLSIILLLSLGITVSSIVDVFKSKTNKDKYIYIITFILSEIYLILIMGSRAAFYRINFTIISIYICDSNRNAY